MTKYTATKDRILYQRYSIGHGERPSPLNKQDNQNEGLKLVLLLFHIAEKNQNRTKTNKTKKNWNKFLYIVFFSTGAALRSAEYNTDPRPNKRNGDIVVKQQQQQAVVRTARVNTEQGTTWWWWWWWTRSDIITFVSFELLLFCIYETRSATFCLSGMYTRTRTHT